MGAGVVQWTDGADSLMWAKSRRAGGVLLATQSTVAESHKVELMAVRGHMPPLCMVSGLRGPITSRGEYILCNASITGLQDRPYCRFDGSKYSN